MELDDEDDAKRNSVTFETLWKEECQRSETPLLTKVVWRFCRRRFITSLLLIVLSIVFQFLGPSVLLQMILEYLEDPTLGVKVGVILVVLLFFNQLFRNISYQLQQSFGTHTALRLMGALQYSGYSKLLRLSSPSDAALGQFITFVTGDHERIQEACVLGPLIIATPVMFLISLVYTTYIIGWYSIVGFLVLMVYYPIMVTKHLPIIAYTNYI